jgi:hypothetical protein
MATQASPGLATDADMNNAASPAPPATPTPLTPSSAAAASPGTTLSERTDHARVMTLLQHAAAAGAGAGVAPTRLARQLKRLAPLLANLGKVSQE